MANHPKLIKIPGTFLDAVGRLLQVAPPPKTKKAKTVRTKAKKRSGAAGTAKRKTARKATGR